MQTTATKYHLPNNLTTHRKTISEFSYLLEIWCRNLIQTFKTLSYENFNHTNGSLNHRFIYQP